MSLIGQVFLKFLTLKDLFILMHNIACFWKPFCSEHANESQKLLKSAEKYFCPTFSSFFAKLSHKKLFYSRCEILQLLVNTLNANCEYSRTNRENLPSQIESQKVILYQIWDFRTACNTLNASCEYFRSNREILSLLIQIKLSKNWYVFYCIFVALLESTLSF